MMGGVLEDLLRRRKKEYLERFPKNVNTLKRRKNTKRKDLKKNR